MIENPSDEQLLIMKILNGIAAALNILIMITATWNCVKYLCKRKINRLLVILFYLFVFTNALINSAMTIYNFFVIKDYSNSLLYQ